MIRWACKTEIQEKQVKIAELEAEGTKVQQVKQAEGDAQVKCSRPRPSPTPCSTPSR